MVWELRVITNLTKQSTEIEILEKAGHRNPEVLVYKGFIFKLKNLKLKFLIKNHNLGLVIPLLQSLFWIVIKIVWLKARRSKNLIWELRVITNLTKQST